MEHRRPNANTTKDLWAGHLDSGGLRGRLIRDVDYTMAVWKGWRLTRPIVLSPTSMGQSSMQIIKDAAAHDALQQYLVRVIAEDVRDALQRAAAGDASLEGAIEAITLTVASIVDGTRDLTHDGKPVIPVLMFGILDEDENITDVLSSGDTSFMHEYAATVAKDVARVEIPATDHRSDRDEQDQS